MRIYFNVFWRCCRQHQGSHEVMKMEEKNTEERKPLWRQGEGDGLTGCAPLLELWKLRNYFYCTHHLHNDIYLCETSREGKVLELPLDAAALSLPPIPRLQAVPTKGVETWQAQSEERRVGAELS